MRVFTDAERTAPYDQELGHLPSIWPPERIRRCGRVEAAPADESGTARPWVSEGIDVASGACLTVSQVQPVLGCGTVASVNARRVESVLSRRLSRGELMQSPIRRGLQQCEERPSLSGRKRRAQSGAARWAKGGGCCRAGGDGAGNLLHRRVGVVGIHHNGVVIVRATGR